jgi:hypothetical protein
MLFEDHLRVLVYFHPEEHKSGWHLLQVLEEDDFARAGQPLFYGEFFLVIFLSDYS